MARRKLKEVSRSINPIPTKSRYSWRINDGLIHPIRIINTEQPQPPLAHEVTLKKNNFLPNDETQNKSKNKGLRSAPTLTPIPWIDKAWEVTHSLERQTAGNHYLYIVLLSGVDGGNPGYALYVGETSKKPEERFLEHIQGRRNERGPLFSRIVKKHGKQLLPNLYSHLVPLSKEEAKKLESEIAQQLIFEGIPVFGGH